jgi:hypothetical protein
MFSSFDFSWFASTTRNKKGRGLVAPFVEAPRSALMMNAPSRAEWRVLGLGHHNENSRFSMKTVAVATQNFGCL